MVSCPDCGGRIAIRSSRSLTPTYRQARADCQNEACGARFGIGVEITHAIIRGEHPNPNIHLPVSPPRNRAPGVPVPANDDGGSEVPLPANDDMPVDTAHG